MANLSQPQVVINYISQLKKITVNRNNQPSQLIIQTDYNLNETYNFQIINKINQIVQLDANTTYQIYGTYIDAKKTVHILFYTLGVTPRDNMLSFLVNTYTSEYLNYVKNNRTSIDISIVAKQNVGGSTRSYMVLRDTALANPRGYIEGQAPTDIVYQNVFTTNVPVSGVFGAGNDINLAQELDEQEIYSFAFGDTLSTNNANQFVIGYNNEPDATKAFIVANSGNIFTVDYEGNVEAGDLNVGAISATSITVSGEDLNQVIDDKVEYLSTSVDDKLSATEDWVSDTFETKESATQTFNELEGEIDDISAFVSGLPEDIAAKADQTDVDAISSFVSGLPQDINDIISAMNQKADKNDLIDLSGTVEGLAETKADLSALQEVTETIAETYATKAALDDYLPRSEYVDTQYTAGEGLALSGNEFRLTAAVGGNYTAGEGLALNGNEFSLTGTVLSGSEHIQVQDNVISLIGDVGKTYSAGSGLALSGEGLSTFVLTANIPSIEGLATEQDLQTVSDAVDDISAFVSGLPTDIAAKASQADLETLSGEVQTKAEASALNDYALTSQLPTDYTTSAQVSSIVEGYNYITSSEIPTSYVQEDDLTDYAKKTDVPVLSSSISAFLAQGSNIKLTVNDQTGVITISGTPEGSTGTTYQAGSGLALSTDNTFVLTATIPTNADISGIASSVTESYGYQTAAQVSGIVEGYNYATTSQIPTTVAELTDASNYALTSQLPTDYTTSAQVSSIVESYDYALTSQLPTDYTTSAQVSSIVESYGYQNAAQVSAIASAYAGSATGDVTSAQVSAIVEGYNYQTASDVSGIVEGYGYATTSQLPTDYTTSAQVSSIVESYGYAKESDIPTTVAQLTDASNYALTSQLPTDYTTSAQVSSIVEGYNFAEASDIPTDYTTSAQVSSIVESYGYITGIANNALLSDIPVSISAITLSAYNASTMQMEATQTSTLALASTDFVTWNGVVYINETKFDIPTDSEISGIASAVTESYGYATTGYVTGYCSSFITEADLPTNKTKLSQFINDVGYITNSSLSSVYGLLTGVNIDITQADDGTITLSAGTGGGGGTTYTAGTGIDISAQDEISVKLSAAQNGNIQVTTSNGVIYLSAAPGGGGGGGATGGDISQFNNDAGYVTTNDITNRQRITTNSQVYNKNIEVYQNEYTPSTSAITLSAFTVSDLTELPVTAAVATFEEWVSTTTPITGITLDANLSSGLIGELPTSYTSGYYYVFVRRIINTGSSTKQYISFAYEFEKPTVQ